MAGTKKNKTKTNPTPLNTNPAAVKQRNSLKTDTEVDSLQLRALAIRENASVNFSLLMPCKKKKKEDFDILEGIRKKIKLKATELQ